VHCALCAVKGVCLSSQTKQLSCCLYLWISQHLFCCKLTFHLVLYKAVTKHTPKFGFLNPPTERVICDVSMDYPSPECH